MMRGWSVPPRARRFPYDNDDLFCLMCGQETTESDSVRRESRTEFWRECHACAGLGRCDDCEAVLPLACLSDGLCLTCYDAGVPA